MNEDTRVEEQTPSGPPHCLPLLLRTAEAAALCGKSLIVSLEQLRAMARDFLR